MRLAPLPIDEHLPAIAAAVATGNLVLVAEPGAGKTTRVPRALLDHGLADRGDVVVLEPRRIAARMAARRVAEELGEEVGKRIGYTVRFDDVSSRETRVRFVTEGVLTRRLVADPELRGVAVVVLDELHERSLHADLALAMVRDLQRRSRPDLRLVAMSATLEAERIASFLGDAPVIRVAGRRFDVAIEHAEAADDRPLERRVAAAVKRALREEPDGHVLVFLPGAAEIRRAAEAIGSDVAADVLPLHGDLPPADQDRAVRPSDRRKVILSTNVAETSLTIDGVVAVIDSGLARVARHSPWSGLPTLETEPICRASATQRAGRAGRTREGRAIRLYTRGDHDGRPMHDAPEIQRVDLADTILALRARGSDPRTFPFFEAPPRPAIAAADDLLRRLGAIDGDGAVTAIGRRILALPLHPRLARVLIEHDRHGLAERGALLVSLLAERDLRLALRTRFGGGDRGAALESGPSDALHQLEIFESVEASGPVNASRLRAHDLDVGGGLAVARARDALVRAISRSRDRAEAAHADLDADTVVLRALLAGFPDRVARRRKPKHPEIVFAAGGSGRLAETSVVRDAELMIAIDAGERRGAVEVRAASAIEAEWLLEDFPEDVEDVREIRFDPSRQRIEKVSGLRYGAVLIDESRGDAAGEPGAAEVLARAAIEAGIDRFLDRDALAQLRLRLALARKVDPSLPELDDAWLEAAVAEAAEGRRSFDELRSVGLLDLVTARLGDAIARLDRLAPSHVSLPGRKRVQVHYEVDRLPWIESRMQDFFGWKEGPKVGGDPVVLHLLAPNQRAVQVTTDLAGFWERHYPTLRKELMRRYPRHAWPEDPTRAG